MGEHGEHSWQDNIRDLELLVKAFTDSATFIKKVYTGNTNVSMQSIDRCREVMLELNQKEHVFNLTLKKLDGDIPDHIQVSLENMKSTITEAHQNATSEIETILKWLPPGLTSRRTDR